jgi:hypothetical protein
LDYWQTKAREDFAKPLALVINANLGHIDDLHLSLIQGQKSKLFLQKLAISPPAKIHDIWKIIY